MRLRRIATLAIAAVGASLLTTGRRAHPTDQTSAAGAVAQPITVVSAPVISTPVMPTRAAAAGAGASHAKPVMHPHGRSRTSRTPTARPQHRRPASAVGHARRPGAQLTSVRRPQSFCRAHG